LDIESTFSSLITCVGPIKFTSEQTRTCSLCKSKGISKQQAANACDSTDPERFYCKRNSTEVLIGFKEKRNMLVDNNLMDIHSGKYCLFIIEDC